MNVTSTLRVYLSRMLLGLYRAFPLAAPTKTSITAWVFRTFAPVFRSTRVYRRWLALSPAQRACVEPASRTVVAPLRNDGESPSTGPRADAAGVERPAGSEPLVIIHAYYPELLPEILDLLARWRQPYELHVTAPPTHASTIRQQFPSAGVTGYVHVFENRGRDILPFLQVARPLTSGNDRLLLKLHTKRSLHRIDGQQWRHDLLERLLAVENAERIAEALWSDHGIGMVGPEGHVLSLASFWGANRANVEEIARRLGVPVPHPHRQAFVAGSMFWSRGAALRPLLELGWERSDFEPEAGQVDGTLAHAIERGFALSVQRAGLRLTDSSDPWTEVASGRRRYLYAAAESDAPSQLPGDFDAAAYLRANPDVSASGQDPAEHYLRQGWAEGRRW